MVTIINTLEQVYWKGGREKPWWLNILVKEIRVQQEPFLTDSQDKNFIANAKNT